MSSGTDKGKTESKKTTEDPTPKQKTCFVIMPIADQPDYPEGHFGRVYEHIIKPACIKAGFKPDRADDAQHTHVIMVNILQRILDADIALCDLSSKNPNVMYELGIRQAFDKPVTLIKDEKTTRIFDTGMLSDVEYLSDMRIDNVQVAVDAIATRLQNTYEKREEQCNSLIQLMKIRPAEAPQQTIVSEDTNVILEAISTLGRRISVLEPQLQDMNPNMKRQVIQARRNVLSDKIEIILSDIMELKKQLEQEGTDGSTSDTIIQNKLVKLKALEALLFETRVELKNLDKEISRTRLSL